MKKRLLMVMMAGAAGWGATIAETAPGGLGQRIIGIGVGIGAAAFTISDTYENVAISASLSSNPGFGSFTGPLETYLTTYVGTGATVAEQVAAGTINVSVNDVAPVDVQVFSGLTLGPGTYYLVLHGRSDPFFWAECLTCTPVLAPGVSLPGDLLFVGTIPAYAPATVFVSSGTTWAFSVTGDLVEPVPEPATAFYALPGFALIWLLRRRLED